MKKVILVDGNSLMFRSFYATAYTGVLMQNKDGLYTNAIFGFVNMISKLLEMEHDYFFVAFDKGKKTFRHQQYDDYKGGRKPMPDEFRCQIPYIKEYLDILNITHEEVDDYEADDLIATVSELAKVEGYDVTVITGDKDLLQLVSENVKVCLTRKGVNELEEYNMENFKSIMGINPCQVPDYKGLIGDSSDNLPGIKGIGPKTASSLLEKYPTLEEVIEHVDEVKGKTHDLLSEGRDVGLKCKYLATLVRDIKLEFSLEDLKKKEPNTKELYDFYMQMNFNSFLKKLDVKTEATLEEAAVTDLLKDTTFSDEVYIDFEIFGETYYTGDILSISILDNDKYYFLPFRHIKEYPNVLNMLQDSKVKKCIYDSKEAVVVLAKEGIMLDGVSDDILLAIYLINPTFASEDLALAITNFGGSLKTQEEVYGKGVKYAIPEDDIISNYAYSKLNILKTFKDEILSKIKDNDQEYIYSIEKKLAYVLASMELKGLYVDRDRLKGIGLELKEEEKSLEEEIYKEAGHEFNINSVKQLGEVLFEEMGLPAGKKNKTGYSTSSDILEKLAPFYNIAKLILDYRAVAKLISTYVDGLEVLINEKGYIHPLYKQALTQTGRLSSIEPNIQNMPIRTERGKVIRDIFVSRFENGLIMSSDYSQIELRVLAHIANDKAMIEMFESGADFHSATASEVFDCSIDEVTKEMRRNAKAINFGIVYGMSAWGLSEQLGIPPQTAAQFIAKYFYKFPSIKEYLDGVVDKAENDGYTKTIANRTRFIPELKNANKAIQEFGKRTAMNAPIQGSAADIIKIAMVNVASRMKGMKSILIAQVHDELVFDVYPDEVDVLKTLVKEEMENAMKLNVKLLAEIEMGESWLKA